MEKFDKFMNLPKKENKIELKDITKVKIPSEVRSVIEKLQKSGYEAYAVGGCVRDILRGAEPKDWDVTTNAKPEELRKIFPKSFYENKFFTVTVRTGSKDQALKEIEVTTYRSETQYTDKRHPDEIKPAETLREDLTRRDFTVNALALDLSGNKPKIIDLLGGQEDLKNGLIRAVGDPTERFREDALRLLRAIRFATTLSMEIEPKTLQTLIENRGLIEFISKERIRDEFLRIINSENAARGIEVSRETKLLPYIIPELLEGYGVEQNKHHIYEIYEHNLRSLDAAAKRGFTTDVRIASLLHDVGKPRTKVGIGPDSTFYDHQIVGAKMVSGILERLKFSRKEIEKITNLIWHHMFAYNPEETTERSIRGLVRSVGPENMEELLQLRIADRIGSGVPKAEPYRLRHLKYLIEKVGLDPISVKMLKINGNDIIKILGIEPGPKIGQILDILLGEILDEPKKNKKGWLQKRVKELGKMADSELKNLTQKARNEREKIEVKRDETTKKKYWVV